MKVPREFWIVESWDPVNCVRYTFDNPPSERHTDQDVIHVIEKSAWEELFEQNKELEQKLEASIENSNLAVNYNIQLEEKNAALESRIEKLRAGLAELKIFLDDLTVTSHPDAPRVSEVFIDNVIAADDKDRENAAK